MCRETLGKVMGDGTRLRNRTPRQSLELRIRLRAEADAVGAHRGQVTSWKVNSTIGDLGFGFSV